jgi:hypothetical protein
MKFILAEDSPELFLLTDIPPLLAAQGSVAIVPAHEQSPQPTEEDGPSPTSAPSTLKRSSASLPPGNDQNNERTLPLDGFRAKLGVLDERHSTVSQLADEREWMNVLTSTLRAMVGVAQQDRLYVRNRKGDPVPYADDTVTELYLRKCDLVTLLVRRGHDVEFSSAPSASPVSPTSLTSAKWRPTSAVAFAFGPRLLQKKDAKWLAKTLGEANRRPGLDKARKFHKVKGREMAFWRVSWVAEWLVKNKYLHRSDAVKIVDTHFPDFLDETQELLQFSLQPDPLRWS